MSKPVRNPPPVINPDKGSHYLKKSPSPTGAKSPPGGSTHKPPEDYSQRKAVLTTNPPYQVSPCIGVLCRRFEILILLLISKFQYKK